MEYLSHSPEETERIGETLGKTLRPGSVVAYRGGLGMGKTAFTRGLARGLGCAGRVTSPTFTIVNEYEGDIPLFHFDLYRLGSSDELFDIGWEDYLARGGVQIPGTPASATLAAAGDIVALSGGTIITVGTAPETITLRAATASASYYDSALYIHKLD